MKNRYKFFAVVFFILSAIACLAGCGSGYRYDDAKVYKAGGASLSAMGIHSIDVDWINGNITLLPSFTNDITFSEETTETNENYVLHYAVIRGELKIKFQKSGVENKNNFSKKLTISIPVDITFQEIDIETVSGDISANNHYASDLKLETVSGNISVNLEGSGSVEADSVSGNVELVSYGAAGFRVEYDTVSGKVTDNIGADYSRVGKDDYYTYGNGAVQVEVDTVSGNLILSEVVAVDDGN